jgi:hypothetical protein
MVSPAPTRFWSPVLAIVLVPALLQQSCEAPSIFDLSSLEVEAAGLNRVVGFSPGPSLYNVWTTAGVDTIVVRAIAARPEAAVDYELSFGGPVMTGDLGNGGGEATLSIPPDTPGELRVGVKVGAIKRFYVVDINPPCDTATCDDANACTSDVCNVTTCEFTSLGNGTSCPIALSDCSQGAPPGAGTCQSGICEAALELCPCDAATAYRAVPRECIAGKVYDPATAACTCEELGSEVPGGGNCNEFGTSVVAGCDSPVPLLSAQLAYDAYVFIDVVSPGSGGPGTVDHGARVVLINPIHAAQGSLELLTSVEVTIGTRPGGTPATLVNRLDPALADTLLAFFLNGTALDLDEEILDETSAFAPAASADVDFYVAGLSLVITIIATGSTYDVDLSRCTFNNPGTEYEPGAPLANGDPIKCSVRTSP